MLGRPNTESIYRRYAIVSEADLRKGAPKLSAIMKNRESKRETVLKKQDNGNWAPFRTKSGIPHPCHCVNTALVGNGQGQN